MMETLEECMEKHGWCSASFTRNWRIVGSKDEVETLRGLCAAAIGMSAGYMRRRERWSALRAAPNMDSGTTQWLVAGECLERALVRMRNASEGVGTEDAERARALVVAAGFDDSIHFPLPSTVFVMAALSFIGYARTVPHTHLCADSGLSESQFLLFRIRMYDTEVFWRASTLSRQQFNSQMVRRAMHIYSVRVAHCGLFLSVLYGHRVAKVSATVWSTCKCDEPITDVKELRLACPRAHKPRVDSSVAFLLIFDASLTLFLVPWLTHTD